jgi:hypothetical protein
LEVQKGGVVDLSNLQSLIKIHDLNKNLLGYNECSNKENTGIIVYGVVYPSQKSMTPLEKIVFKHSE